MATRVVILGGGFAGVATAKELVASMRSKGRLRSPAASPGPDSVEVVLVNRENYFVFQPLLADILPGTINTTHVVVPLRRMLPDVNVEVGVVEEVDTSASSVQIRRRLNSERLAIGYDQLVLALGSVTDFRAVPGMAEHAVGLRTLGDAFYLRNRALNMLEEADLEPDDNRRQSLLTFVVVGGGSTGTEVAAELNDLVRHAARSFGLRRLRPRVLLVHGRKLLLPSFGVRLGRYATRKVAEMGVRLVLGRRLTRVEADGVELDDGTWIPAATVISTVGNAPHPVVAALQAPTDERGWIRPDATFAVPGLDNVWALGDCASIPDPHTGEPVPATAQHAVREGSHLASNILATLGGRRVTNFRYEAKGMLVSLGWLKGVGVVFGIKISGLLAWLLWRGYYLMQLPSWDRRVRVGIDWFVDLFLPRDIVQIDVRRSRTRPDSDIAVESRLELPPDTPFGVGR